MRSLPERGTARTVSAVSSNRMQHRTRSGRGRGERRKSEFNAEIIEQTMNKNEICEALCALPGGAVVRRRKPFSMPLVMLFAGAALIVANRIWGAGLNNDLRSALVFVGGVLAIVGLMTTLARLFGGGVPYHTEAEAYLRYEELYFDRKWLREVASYVESGDVKRLRALERSRVPAVAVALYATPDGRFSAMQAFEYADLEYRPLSGLKVVNR